MAEAFGYVVAPGVHLRARHGVLLRKLQKLIGMVAFDTTALAIKMTCSGLLSWSVNSGQ